VEEHDVLNFFSLSSLITAHCPDFNDVQVLFRWPIHFRKDQSTSSIHPADYPDKPAAHELGTGRAAACPALESSHKHSGQGKIYSPCAPAQRVSAALPLLTSKLNSWIWAWMSVWSKRTS
jgi:hypothetical protein